MASIQNRDAPNDPELQVTLEYWCALQGSLKIGELNGYFEMPCAEIQGVSFQAQGTEKSPDSCKTRAVEVVVGQRRLRLERAHFSRSLPNGWQCTDAFKFRSSSATFSLDLGKIKSMAFSNHGQSSEITLLDGTLITAATMDWVAVNEYVIGYLNNIRVVIRIGAVKSLSPYLN